MSFFKTFLFLKKIDFFGAIFGSAHPYTNSHTRFPHTLSHTHTLTHTKLMNMDNPRQLSWTVRGKIKHEEKEEKNDPPISVSICTICRNKYKLKDVREMLCHLKGCPLASHTLCSFKWYDHSSNCPKYTNREDEILLPNVQIDSNLEEKEIMPSSVLEEKEYQPIAHLSCVVCLFRTGDIAEDDVTGGIKEVFCPDGCSLSSHKNCARSWFSKSSTCLRCDAGLDATTLIPDAQIDFDSKEDEKMENCIICYEAEEVDLRNITCPIKGCVWKACSNCLKHLRFGGGIAAIKCVICRESFHLNDVGIMDLEHPGHFQVNPPLVLNNMDVFLPQHISYADLYGQMNRHPQPQLPFTFRVEELVLDAIHEGNRLCYCRRQLYNLTVGGNTVFVVCLGNGCRSKYAIRHLREAAEFWYGNLGEDYEIPEFIHANGGAFSYDDWLSHIQHRTKPKNDSSKKKTKLKKVRRRVLGEDGNMHWINIPEYEDGGFKRRIKTENGVSQTSIHRTRR